LKGESVKGIVIIEGCDGTGKTTLAKKLCEKYDGHYIHNTYRWPNKMPLYHTAALHRAIKLAEKKLVVIDRLWMSEAIYAAVYRNGSPWPQMGRMLDRIILKHCGIYIMCELPEDHKERFQQLKYQREEMYDDVSEVGKRFQELIWGRGQITGDNYADYISFGGMCERDDCLIYNVDQHGKDMNMFCNLVADALEHRQSLQWLPGLSKKEVNFAGFAMSAKYLMVGDAPNPKMRAIRWPFFDFGHSSNFLAKVMHELLIDETECVWVNANFTNGGMNIRELKNSFDLQIIALGANAADTIKDLRLDDSRMIEAVHPSYALRFNHQEDFKRQLKRRLV